MANKRSYINKAILIAVPILILVGIKFYSNYTNNRYSAIYQYLESNKQINPGWHLVIYIDIDACLSCTVDMEALNRVEDYFRSNDYLISLWAPAVDSFDVAYAMDLEGLLTPVEVIDSITIRDLGWDNRPTPIMVLFDGINKPVCDFGPGRNVEESRKLLDRIMAMIG